MGGEGLGGGPGRGIKGEFVAVLGKVFGGRGNFPWRLVLLLSGGYQWHWEKVMHLEIL